MNFNFRYSDTFGSIYKCGNVCFLPDGDGLISPIGNKLKVIDLKRNTSYTLRTQFGSNILNVAINSTGTHAIVSDEFGGCNYINLINDIVLHKFFPGSNGECVKSLKFSPDGRFIAIGLTGIVIIYSLASYDKIQFNPVIQMRRFKHSVESVNSVEWSNDGRIVIGSGENGISKVFTAFKQSFVNANVCTLSERAAIVSAYFFSDDYDILVIDKSGQTTIWTSSIKSSELIPWKKGKRYTEEELEVFEKMRYSRKQRHNLQQHSGSSSSVSITATALKRPKLLFVSFSNGVFCLLELDEFVLLQSFRATEMAIKSLSINPRGDWVAIGCGQSNEGQLLVWEWQSETYILKQQSHNQTITSAAYSPDGSLIATGAEDGKVKIWNCRTSFCVVTFADHTSGVTAVCFTQSGKAILSASLDGTVRAHDMIRYRNFRTMAAPKQTQLSLLCCDQSGDFVMASSRDEYEVFVWSFETGNLLEVLAGHSSVISGISCYESTFASVSLDKTLRVWNILEASCIETVQLLGEGLDVKYSPIGSTLAALCYDSCICLFDTRNMQQQGTIDTRLDIDAGRQRKNLIKKSTSEKNKTFTCIEFSPDGLFIIAGGQSNNFCLYSVSDRMLLRSFKLTINLSLDGVNFDYDYRKMTEFGHLELFDLSDDEEEISGKKRIPLPGTRHSDMSERSMRPVMCVNHLSFSPTGQNFAVVSTEGVSVFSQNFRRRFDPFQLETDINPENLKKTLAKGDFAKSLCMALRLNDNELIQLVAETIPSELVKTVLQGLGMVYAPKFLRWITTEQATSKHIQFYQIMIKELLTYYGADLKASLEENGPTITAVQQMLAQQNHTILRVANQNKHSLEYLLVARKLSRIKLRGSNSTMRETT